MDRVFREPTRSEQVVAYVRWVLLASLLADLFMSACAASYPRLNDSSTWPPSWLCLDIAKVYPELTKWVEVTRLTCLASFYGHLFLLLMLPTLNLYVVLKIFRERHASDGGMPSWCDCGEKHFMLSGFHFFMVTTFFTSAYFEYISKSCAPDSISFKSAVVFRLQLFPSIFRVLMVTTLLPYVVMVTWNTHHAMTCQCGSWGVVVPGCNAKFHIAPHATLAEEQGEGDKEEEVQAEGKEKQGSQEKQEGK